MARSPQVEINPEVLRWARESCGATIEEAAKKAKVSPSEYREWESNGRPIRLTQLEALAVYFKRPFAALFLPKPPLEPPRPKDFRALPGRRDKFERKTLLAIRRALRKQAIAAELAEQSELNTEPAIGQANIGEDPEVVATRERQALGVSVGEQVNWPNESVALEAWRDALERNRIFVFSFPMSIEDARGFSLTYQLPWAIVVNASDAIRARAFTLFHEYGHLLLRSPGVCMPQLEWRKGARVGEEEQWCNKFAAAFLLPAGAIGELTRKGLLSVERLPEWIADLSSQFKVSREVVLRRLLTLGLISSGQFWDELDRLNAIAAKRPKKPTGFASPWLRCVRQNGQLFTRMVLNGQARGIVDYRDVSDLLGIKLNHLSKVEALLTAR